MSTENKTQPLKQANVGGSGFRLVETMSGFCVEKLVPKIKVRSRLFWFGEPYYDESDKIWLKVNSRGEPIYPRLLGEITESFVLFQTIEGAKEFVQKVIKPKVIEYL